MFSTRTAQPLYLLPRGQPVNGPQGTLAGIAEPGATLMSQQVSAQGGTWINRGTKQSPQWERPAGWNDPPSIRR